MNDKAIADECRAILARYVGKEKAAMYKPLGVVEQLARLLEDTKEQLRISEHLRGVRYRNA